MHPVPVSERISILYAEKGTLERDGHSIVLRNDTVDTLFPIGKTAAIFMGPGTKVTHAAVALCAKEGAMLLWVGEHSVRLYCASEPRGNPEKLVQQAVAFSSPTERLAVARKLFEQMFNEPAPLGRSIDQLRGLEGARVKLTYAELSEKYGIPWTRREHAPMDSINSAVSAATAALYGLTEAVILTLGYSPGIGFVHSGDKRSFVYDVADTVKFKTVVPLAFKVCSESTDDIERRVRKECRNTFADYRLAAQLVGNIEGLFNGIDRH